MSGVLVKDFINYFLSLQINILLLHIITNDLTTKVCNFPRGFLTKHTLRNIRGSLLLVKPAALGLISH